MSEERIENCVREVEKYLRGRREELVEAAGNVAYEHKEDDTIVTSFDSDIERDARKILNKRMPEAGIIGEEHGQEGSNETFWTIDPIDGTEHFMRDDPFYTFMMGLVVDNQPVASLIYNYSLDKSYVALPGRRAVCNGQEISISERGLARAIVETEFRFEHPKAFDLINKVAVNVYVPQKIGAAAGHGLTQVARGASEARIQLNGYGKIWDYLPGQILVKAAGGVIQTIGSDGWDWRNLNSIASNKVVANELRQIVRESTGL